MDMHWAQVRRDASSRAAVWRLRALGALGTLAALAALALCLWVDHALMALLVWVMALAASALMVVFTMTWRPHWLRLMAWVCAKKN
ncbi:DUF3325 family protein [Acidovorax sp. SUPP3434]|uniref:DUF3325 family protein n=1 Tax=Acidovorax sp. SUPP3434 TaxID=2920880 RepID=UPI0023DE2C9C|nr:DUF3325 family protein [Acidovorax sp. SUPP3434]GKT00521.1 DUF3325 family protein [Acidovorax sp. SUPP3434]